MKRKSSLREPMPMPNPHFLVKVHKVKSNEIGKTLFSHHWHPHLELLYIVTGKAKFECNSSILLAEAGDFIVINCNDLHHGLSLSDDLYYYAIIVDPAVLHSYSVDAVDTKFITPITQNQILIQNQIKNNPQIRNSVLAIVEEISHRQLGFELAVKSELYHLLTLLMRDYVKHVFSASDYHTRIKNLERFTPVFQYIEQHYQQEITVEHLADIAGLSRFHFSRLFKELTNKTITEYINKIRIDKSEYLLRNTSKSISEIALASGFNDIYYFSRIFKKNKQVSPSEIRDQIK